jgi:hypothetical protein
VAHRVDLFPGAEGPVVVRQGERPRRPGVQAEYECDNLTMEVFRDLMAARIIEPTSELDSARVLEEADVAPASYPTANRLPVYARDSRREELSAECGRGPGGSPHGASSPSLPVLEPQL